jgi:hypothetical protein
VLALIRRSDVPLDDDQIAVAAHMNRIYVNAWSMASTSAVGRVAD